VPGKQSEAFDVSHLQSSKAKKAGANKRSNAQLVRRLGNRNVVVMMGGTSAEREISLLTGQAMLKALRAQKIRVRGVDVKRRDDVLGIVAQKPAVVVNALHGPGGEDGVVQGIFEWFGIPLTGSGVLASSLAMNKHMAKQVMQTMGLPTAPWRMVLWSKTVPRGIQLPVVIKPNRQGSAIGVSVVREKKELAAAWQQAGKFGDEIMLEHYVPGREISIGVLGRTALPVIEIVPKKLFYDYEAKYVSGMSDHIIPARMSKTMTRKAQALAVQTVAALGCQGAPRVDMIVTAAGKCMILEVNTLPGMTATSLLPEAAQHAGISFTELILRLILNALGELA
jgi:D-alanine-D-alanine ligase